MEAREVEVGAPFTVEAEAASGTGYAWTVAEATPGLTTVGEPGTMGEARMPGAPVRVAFTLVAETAGEYELALALRRPWEDAAAERRRIRITAR